MKHFLARSNHLIGWVFVVGAAVGAGGVVCPMVATAATFDPVPLAPDLELNVLDRSASERQMGRQLFENPWDVAIVGNVDLYDHFPYVESHQFAIVSDPGWNRLVATETSTGRIVAFDAGSSEFGPMSGPRGLALGPDQRLYVCDTGNNRILVGQLRVEHDLIDVEWTASIDGVSRPHDIAVSDAGTPYEEVDDWLVVAETGGNRVSTWTTEEQPQRLSVVGGLGSGAGRFAGPMAVAVGRDESGSTGRIFVSDAHNRRVVCLHNSEDGLTWDRTVIEGVGLITSLEMDVNGGLYCTSPTQGQVAKYSPDFTLVSTSDEPARPKSFHLPTVTVTDHRSGTIEKTTATTGVLVEDWSPATGLKAYALGVEVKGLVVDGSSLSASFLLTDPADVRVRVVDFRSGNVVAETQSSRFESGRCVVSLSEDDFVGTVEAGTYDLHVDARPIARTASMTRELAGATGETATARFDLESSLLGSSGVAALLGCSPSPFKEETRIRFSSPAAGSHRVHVFDVAGREVRTLDATGSGYLDVVWDGRDDAGHPLGSGMYLYRITVGESTLNGRVVLLH